VRELVGAVGWLHGVGVVHRDVKLESTFFLLLCLFLHLSADIITDILLTDPTFPSTQTHRTPLIKLTDFGLSTTFDPASPLLTARCGSEAYAAPELVVGRVRPGPGSMGAKGREGERGEEGRGGEKGWYDGRETDSWAVGIVIYALVCRALPFGEGVPSSSPSSVGFVGVRERGVGKERKWNKRGSGGWREEKKGREKWLMKIAKGEYTWPPSPSTLFPESESEPRSTNLARLPLIRNVVDRLLVRDRKMRAGMGDIARDGWVSG
jgi:protein-serine/threonine kinase